MGETNCAATCRWAIPTLFLPRPIWLNAADSPWTCTRTAYAHVLETTEVCQGCPDWTPRDAVAPVSVRTFER